MHPLSWVSKLMFLILIYFTSVSIPLNYAALDGDATNGTSDCNSVPYPFGVQGAALTGFEVLCTSSTAANRTNSSKFLLPTGSTTANFSSLLPYGNSTKGMNPSLELPSGTYLIQNISLQGQVSIFAGPVFRQYYDNGTKPVLRPGNGWLNLTGTPFSLSQNSTTLVVIGCDDVVVFESVDEDGNSSGKSYNSGCVSFCSNSTSRFEYDGSCSGLGCCQMPLPGPVKSFKLRLYKFENMGVDRWTNHSVVFFTTRDDFAFRAAAFNNDTYFITSEADHVTVLDWAIGNNSCEEAKIDVDSFACKKNSYCFNSPNGVGYLCNCSQGYEGNPYIEGGCTDVDECKIPEFNPCSIGHCINIPGSFTCECPSDMTGDGRKEGSGCTKKSPIDVITLGICLCVVFILAVAILYSYSRWHKRKMVKMRSEFFRQNGGWILQQRLASQEIDATTRIFTAEQFQIATDNYSENRILGRGGYGTVYKGVLSNQQVVAIKRSKVIDESQVEQFINEITILSQISHRNVVHLMGCCLETQVPLLVYEFISNGTLFQHIHNNAILPWEDRIRISRETARAIAYLHSAASFPIIHRDIKSSNILLDEKYTAKVSDFGASRSVPFEMTHITTLVQGTLGYLDPEYFYTSQLTDKSDVYSFGVVLAELLTGEMPVSFDRSEDHRNLATYFTSMVEEGRLIQAIEPHLLAEAKLDELHFVAHLTRRCLNVKGEERPSMKVVALELEGLTRFTKKSANNERFIEKVGSTSTISEVSEISRQYSLECQFLSAAEYPR